MAHNCDAIFAQVPAYENEVKGMRRSCAAIAWLPIGLDLDHEPNGFRHDAFGTGVMPVFAC